MTRRDLTGRVKDEARRLGFDKAGVALAVPLSDEAPRLRTWIASGYHAGMAWMERTEARRNDPALVYPEVRSILSVAMNYYHPEEHSTDPHDGKISRYAWGEDYHRVLTARLEQLLSAIRAIEPGADGRVYVDTGPVMEKLWAQRAGIGWEGKHSNIITKELGSWIFLGEILLNIVLEPDPPATDHCGDCTLCIEACPTEAIVAPYIVDSSKCISYLTIEHRGSIPEELGAKFDSWIFGCDICQDVCPWNERFAQESAEEAFRPRPEHLRPSLAQIRGMSAEEFTTRFQTSPVKRATHAGLVRNASQQRS